MRIRVTHLDAECLFAVRAIAISIRRMASKESESTSGTEEAPQAVVMIGRGSASGYGFWIGIRSVRIV